MARQHSAPFMRDRCRVYSRSVGKIPQQIEAYLVSGDYDYLLRIAVSGTQDYERLLRERL